MGRTWQLWVSIYGGHSVTRHNPMVLSRLEAVTTSFAVGIWGQDVLTEDDNILVHIGQDMRVEKGQAEISYVPMRNSLRQTTQQSNRYDITPQGRELTLGIRYGRAWGKEQQTSLKVGVDYVMMPSHHRTQDDQWHGVISLDYRF